MTNQQLQNQNDIMREALKNIMELYHAVDEKHYTKYDAIIDMWSEARIAYSRVENDQ